MLYISYGVSVQIFLREILLELLDVHYTTIPDYTNLIHWCPRSKYANKSRSTIIHQSNQTTMQTKSSTLSMKNAIFFSVSFYALQGSVTAWQEGKVSGQIKLVSQVLRKSYRTNSLLFLHYLGISSKPRMFRFKV